MRNGIFTNDFSFFAVNRLIDVQNLLRIVILNYKVCLLANKFETDNAYSLSSDLFHRIHKIDI